MMLRLVLLIALFATPALADGVRVVAMDRRWEQGDLQLKAAFTLVAEGDFADRFGGLSGAAFDGERLLALTDRGLVAEMRLGVDGDGVIESITVAAPVALCDAEKKPLSGGAVDSEALVRLPDGRFVVAFERAHRLVEYGAEGLLSCGPPRRLDLPEGAERLAHNGGMEALARRADGALFVLSEDPLDGMAETERALFRLQGGAWSQAIYLTTKAFRPTDAVFLPGGDLIVLERSYSPLAGVDARLVRIPAADLDQSRITGIEIADFGFPLPMDNYEVIAARPAPDGATDLILLTDDNFSPTQTTLLVQLRLKDQAGAVRPRAVE